MAENYNSVVLLTINICCRVVPSQKPLKIFVVLVCLAFCLFAFNLAHVRDTLTLPDTPTSAIADTALPVLGAMFLTFNVGMLFVA